MNGGDGLGDAGSSLLICRVWAGGVGAGNGAVRWWGRCRSRRSGRLSRHRPEAGPGPRPAPDRRPGADHRPEAVRRRRRDRGRPGRPGTGRDPGRPDLARQLAPDVLPTEGDGRGRPRGGTHAETDDEGSGHGDLPARPPRRLGRSGGRGRRQRSGMGGARPHRSGGGARRRRGGCGRGQPPPRRTASGLRRRARTGAAGCGRRVERARGPPGRRGCLAPQPRRQTCVDAVLGPAPAGTSAPLHRNRTADAWTAPSAAAQTWSHDDDPLPVGPGPPASRRLRRPRARGGRRAQPHRAAVDGPALRGLGRPHGGERASPRCGRRRTSARRGRARHDAPRLRRPRGAAPDARRRPRRAGALPHRQGRRRGPRRRAHRRRRRLRHQAVQPRGGRRPAARPDAPHHGRGRRRRARCSSSATSRWTRTATRSAGPATRST